MRSLTRIQRGRTGPLVWSRTSVLLMAVSGVVFLASAQAQTPATAPAPRIRNPAGSTLELGSAARGHECRAGTRLAGRDDGAPSGIVRRRLPAQGHPAAGAGPGRRPASAVAGQVIPRVIPIEPEVNAGQPRGAAQPRIIQLRRDATGLVPGRPPGPPPRRPNGEVAKDVANLIERDQGARGRDRRGRRANPRSSRPGGP